MKAILAIFFTLVFVASTFVGLYAPLPAENSVMALPQRLCEVLATVHGAFLWVLFSVAALFVVAAISVAYRHGLYKGRDEAREEIRPL